MFFRDSLTRALARLIPPARGWRAHAVPAAIFVWIVLIAIGGRVMFDHAYDYGPPAEAPARWPEKAGIPFANGKFALVLLVHPDCPCTRASLSELEILMTRANGKLAATVLFSKPGLDDASYSEFWGKSESIPGVFTRFDRGGRITKSFGAFVSGQTLLYHPSGNLLFNGGITVSRGHEGGNRGVDAILAHIGNQPQAAGKMPVFGCALFNAVTR